MERKTQIKSHHIEQFLKNNTELNSQNEYGITPLVCLIQNIYFEDNTILELLLLSGSNIKSIDDNGNTPLHHACKRSGGDYVKILLDKNSDPNIKNKNGETAFSVYLSQASIDISTFDLLMEKGADLKVPDSTQTTPLHRLCSKNNFSEYFPRIEKSMLNPHVKNNNGETQFLLFLKNVSNVDQNLLNFFLTNQVDVNTEDKLGFSLLHYSLKNSLDFVSDYLIEKRADVNATNVYQKTPLHIASSNNVSYHIFLKLLENGANSNFQDEDGNSTLHIFVYSLKNKEVDNNFFQLLLDKKADCNLYNKIGKTPFHLLIFSKTDFFPNLTLFLSHGANINSQDIDGYTLLHYASKNSHHKLLNFLIENKSDVNLKNKEEETPFLLFVKQSTQKLKIYNLFLKQKINFKDKDKEGNTFLHIVCSKTKPYNFIKMVLDTNQNIIFDFSSKNNEGITPIYNLLVNNVKSYSPLFTNFLLKQNVIDHQWRDSLGNTQLHFSIENRFDQFTVMALENGANINQKNNLGLTPLTANIRSIELLFLEKLFQFKVDINLKDNNGSTLLHLISSLENYKYFSYILLKGADVNIQNNQDETPLHLLAKRSNLNDLRLLLEREYQMNLQDSSLCTILHYSHESLLELIISKKGDVNIKNNLGDTPFISQLKKANDKSVEEICQIFVKYGADINATNNENCTALHYCSDIKNLKSIEILLENKADCNVFSKSKLTPSHCFLSKNSKLSFELFLKNGANINLHDENNVTLLSLSLFNLNYPNIISLLESNADANIVPQNYDNLFQYYLNSVIGFTQVHIIQLLFEKGGMVIPKNAPLFHYKNLDSQSYIYLLKQGYDSNIFDQNGNHPLIYFLFSHRDNLNLVVLMLLLEKKANVNVISKSGSSPLSILCQTCVNSKAISILLNHDADPNFVYNKNSAFISFIQNNLLDKNLLNLFLDKKADLNLLNKSKMNASHHAFATQNKDVLDVLIHNGADMNIQDSTHTSPFHYLLEKNKFLDFEMFNNLQQNRFFIAIFIFYFLYFLISIFYFYILFFIF